jgi:enoyl-CoA hydratase/carnithine racemase
VTVEIKLEKHGGWPVVNICISAPTKLNAIGLSTALALQESLAQLPTNMRALILTANTVDRAGKRFWIAGGDLKELAGLDQAQAKKYAQIMRGVCEGFRQLPVPVLAFIDGAAIGGGAEWAIAADLRVGTADTEFHWKQLSMGLPTGYGGSLRLRQLLGAHQAEAMIYFQKKLDAQGSLRSGLVHEIVDDKVAFEKILQNVCDIEPAAFAAQKKMFATHASDSKNPTDLDHMFATSWKNPTHLRMLSSFLEKERP